MTTSAPPERLQPALLDRLIGGAGDAGRSMSRQQLRTALLRDLEDLLRSAPALAPRWQGDPVLAASVLNYGLPPLAGRTASSVEPAALEAALRQVLLRFEPRLLPATLGVRALAPTSLLHTHNVVELEIRGQLWSHPVPLDVLLRTCVNLESGQVTLREA